MKDEQVMIKFLRHNKNGKEWVYPKPYIFKLTPKDKKEFKEYLQKGQKGIIRVDKVKNEGTVEVPFMIEEIGHFDDELRKPLIIVRMFDD